MRTHATLSLAAAVVALCAAARPASAQSAQIPTPRADVVAAAAVRTVAVYRLGRTALSDLPATVTVADSAGTLVARYGASGAAGERAMAVTVLETDLVLQAETPSGLLTLLLEKQNETAGSELTGRWWLGTQAGELRARVAR
jgi:hypothetical protein